MSQYLLAMIQPDGPPPSNIDEIMADVAAISSDLHDAGAWVFGNGLTAPDEAVVVRAAGGEAAATDGPYTESAEHLGGITIIEVDDAAAARAWAGRLAVATGLPIEVRAFQ